MKTAIMRGCIVIITIALIICAVLSAVIFSEKQTDIKREELTRIAGVISDLFDPTLDNDMQADQFAKNLDGIRITIIDKDGHVTGDSSADYSIMEDHLDRPEIREARGTGLAVSVRQSDTIGTRLMYVAIKTPDGYYIRLSEEYSSIFGNLSSLLPAIIPAALISLLVSILLANEFSRRITRHITAMNDSLSRVKSGHTKLNPDEYPYEELKDMATKVNALAADISKHIGKLQDEKDKISFIMDNMKEGLILLRSRQTVLLINDRACLYLDCSKEVIGENITHCTRHYAFLQAIDDAMEHGENRSIDLILGGRVIEAVCIYVHHQQEADDARLIITMTDVTERRSAVKIRRDFFSNASHELKTPITSIRGGAELLCSGVPLDAEQQVEILTRIKLEADRMCTLINDIIMINRIESGEIITEKEYVDFDQIIRNSCAEVLPLIDQHNLTLHTDLSPTVLYANRKNLSEMVSNLMINAVIYNNPGGRIDITLKSDERDAILTVRNDGELIPIEYQNRVFERFFRVDKGRSKTVGGTGLGLSIVKHVVDSMNGTILLRSNERNGTSFQICLPKE